MLDPEAGLVFATARDVSEAALLRGHLAAIVDHSADAIFSLNLDRVIVSWNAGAERLFGYAASETIGRSVTLLRLPAGPDAANQIRGVLLSGESVIDLDTSCRHKDGHTIPVSLSVSPVLDGAGVVTGSASIVRDISARKQAEAAQRQLDHQFHEILSVAPVGAAIVGPDGTIEYANQAYAALHGYSVDELIGRNLAFLRPEEQREALMAAFFARMSSGDSTSHDAEALTKSGSLRTLHVTSVTFVGLDGRPRRASFVLDRTEQKHAEQLLAHSATHDPLTGLPNRAYFQDRLAQDPAYKGRCSCDGLGGRVMQ